jgi:hypothetical protein
VIYKVQCRYDDEEEWTDHKYYFTLGAAKGVLTRNRRTADWNERYSWMRKVEWRIVAAEEPEWTVLDF